MKHLILTVSLLTLPLLAAAKPNVVFILADDLGWRDLSVEGSTFYESPHIDRIANSGVRFTRGYAACQVCSPSRAALMTGKAPARIGITDYIGAAEGEAWKRNTRLLPARYVHQLPAEDVTLAEAFKEAGYRTFFAGKWHLGGEGSFPEDHGFDINIGGHHRGSPPGGFFSPYNNPKMADGPPGEYLPVRLGRETAGFIDAQEGTPFFAYLSFYNVHAPIQTTRELWQKYRDKAAATIPAPDHRFLIDRTSPVRQIQDHPVYAGMVEGMDRGVGLVLDALERNGLTENTIVCFTSDNGGVSAGDGKATSNLPLRGGKGRQWEGGIREPFHISWPGKIAPAVNDTPVIGMDFYPTLLDLVGLPPRPDQHVDGTSLAPLLRGESTAIADRPLFWHYPHYGNQGGEPSAIMSQDDWKLIHYYEDGRDELYHLAEDAGEQSDLAAAQPERVQTMRAQLDAWLKATNAAMPWENPDFNPEAFAKQENQTRERTLPSLEKQAAGFLKPDYDPKNRWWGSGD